MIELNEEEQKIFDELCEQVESEGRIWKTGSNGKWISARQYDELQIEARQRVRLKKAKRKKDAALYKKYKGGI